MYNIKLILGSTREGRHGEKVAKLVQQLFNEKKDEVSVDLIDLRDWNLPFYDESKSMQYHDGNFKNEIVNKWHAKIAEGDAFVIVTPEYNHGYPAIIKNALDYAYHEWKKKPVTFASYSASPIGGARAVEQLRQVAIELHMAPIRDALHLGTVWGDFDELGNYAKMEGLVPAFETMYTELMWWTKALKEARNK